jgi:hypothetical protein
MFFSPLIRIDFYPQYTNRTGNSLKNPVYDSERLNKQNGTFRGGLRRGPLFKIRGGGGSYEKAIRNPSRLCYKTFE